MPKPRDPATIAAQAAGAHDGATGGVVPGISVATTYRRGIDYALQHPENSYGRDDNATTRQAEEVLRQLEGAAATRLFASGMAVASAMMRTVPTGGRIVLQSGIYYGVSAFARGFAARRGVTLDEVDASDVQAMQAACARPADLVWIEVPSNPWLKVADIEAVAKAAKTAGAALVVDATAATPILLNPIQLGADFVMHSATKAINGHSDVLAGVLSCANAEHPMWHAVLAERHDAGAVPGPFESWLCLRGMRTLPLRVERMSDSALRLAQRLQAHPGVESVLYPGLPEHEGHDVAARQMTGGYGSLMSVLIAGGHEAAARVTSRLRLFQRATSLGGVESLVEHRHVIEPQSGLPENLLRFSIGLEAPDDLWDDLVEALER
ncbi:MAG: aminotransferase class V-fold PLP-dependent enzyme [Pseudomonadota bacterium]